MRTLPSRTDWRAWSPPFVSATIALLLLGGFIVADRSPSGGVVPLWVRPFHALLSFHPSPVQEAAEVNPTPFPLKMEADATQTVPRETIPLLPLLRTIAVPSPQAAALRGELPASPPAKFGVDWFQWARLATSPAKVTTTLPSDVPAEKVLVYATTAPEGLTVCVANRAARPAQLRLQVRLKGGTYRAERLTFGKRATDPPTAEGVRLDRMEGSDLPQKGEITKNVSLDAGQTVLFRWTDNAREARLALETFKERVRSLANVAAEPAEHLRRIQRESDPYLGCLDPGNRLALNKRLGSVHRLILLTAQAQSRHRNDQQNGSIPAELGAEVMGALERYVDALAEMSATLLYLVPQITVVPDAPAASGNPPPAGTRTATVTLVFANAGPQSVTMVKLGVGLSALPPGTSCEPPDPAYFGTLAPGQSVRTTFQLRYPATADFAAWQCAGDFSYFTAATPAHLRARPW